MEFDAISERDGVLGAMDTMYRRGKMQDESMYYEHKKHDESLPLIGVNTLLPKDHAGAIATEIELIRSTEEKGAQIANVRLYGEARNYLAGDSLKVLQGTARERRNVFEELIEVAEYNSLGQISNALYEVGGGIGGICEYKYPFLRRTLLCWTWAHISVTKFTASEPVAAFSMHFLTSLKSQLSARPEKLRAYAKNFIS